MVVSAVFNLGINAINASVAEERKSAAYQAALPVIQQVSQYDLKLDMAHTLTSELKGVQWMRLTTPVAISRKTIGEKEKSDLSKFANYPVFLASMLPTDRPERFYLTTSFVQRVQNNYALATRTQLMSKDDGVVIYRRDSLFICPGTPSQDWVAWWTADGGQRLRTAYSKGLRAAAEMVAMDLGARAALDDNIEVKPNEIGMLVAQCAKEWWK